VLQVRSQFVAAGPWPFPPDPAMATMAATGPLTTVDMPRLTTVTDIDRVYRPAYAYYGGPR